MDFNICLVDDDSSLLSYLEEQLTSKNYTVSAFQSANQAIEFIRDNLPQLVITDVKMDEMTGDEILSAVKKINPDIGVILITGFGNISHSVNAMRKGAFDYITKPFSGSEFIRRVEYFFEVLQNIKPQTAAQKFMKHSPGEEISSKAVLKQNGIRKEYVMVGEHMKIKHLLQILRQIAPTDAPVLIQGESGTGKEVYSNLIQKNSLRSAEPFVKINCANLPVELVESTLFGHAKGAFTGAVSDYEGAFSKANGGTLLLDEITEVDVNVQAKLLRVLQEKEFQAVGSQQTKSVDVRIIATTNRDVGQAIEQGVFRKDLYYRINVFPVRIPPLRERPEDIPVLAKYFADVYSNTYGLPPKTISKELEFHMQKKLWKGNVRELENYIIRGVIMAQEEPELTLEHTEDGMFKNLDDDLSQDLGQDIPLLPIEELEIQLIKKALAKTGGNQKEAAKLLGITDRTIRNKLKKIDDLTFD